jgi:hypothetical protein
VSAEPQVCNTEVMPDPGTQMLRIGCDRQHGLGRDLEQKIVEDGLVLIGDVSDGRRQREHHVIVRHRQQLGLAVGEPLLRSGALALRAMPVAAGVVGDRFIGAVLASRDMAAESCRAAALDRRHHLHLVEVDMAGIGFAPYRAMAAEDIRNLQSRARHKRRASAGGLISLNLSARCSSGLKTSLIVLVAT